MSQGKSSYNLRHQSELKKSTSKPSVSSKMSSTSSTGPSGKPSQSTPIITEPRREADHVTENPPNSGSSPVMTAIGELKGMFVGLSQQVTKVNSKLDCVMDELNNIKSELSTTKKTVSELEDNVNLAHDKIMSIEKDALPKLQEQIEREREELDTKLTLLEIHDRKQNLLVYGVPCTRNENIFAVIRDLFCHFLQIVR